MSDSERSEVSMESEDAAEPEREDRNSTLFTDDRESFNARSSKTTRKLPKGLSVELLKQAAVGSRQLLVQMSNHPRCESFLEE
ncbi:MAG: uncharacterized protein KVP18_000074 [Porospora cf. gigantea A]|uniref:uncharacterized protein n=1 Tax=Porospora cf. gigantea A TaxID=2853593 RepID=UPI00355AA4E5|nr:MAG: hypothetical protein KVP18_000074 [Porospora cf. gigantea A]